MVYVPILKSKPAEYAALANADADVRGATFPLIEVVPPADETDPVAMEAVCRTVIAKVSDGWDQTVAVDPGYLDVTLATSSGLNATEVLADEARTRGLPFVPVVRLSDPPGAVAAAARVASLDGQGVLVRLAGDDLQEDAGTLDVWFADLEAELELSPADMDVLVDLGAVAQGSSIALGARVARDLINGLARVAEWRTLTVASGAFPADLNAIAASSTGALPRLDAQLWTDVCARSLVRQPDYGDYAIQHPSLPATGGFGPAPQIRYTVDSFWRIYKGSKKDRRGHAQFYDICALLVASGEFAGRAHSWGDAYVEDAATSATGSAVVGTGNATTWRTVGTSHHMATVVNRLATTGAP